MFTDFNSGQHQDTHLIENFEKAWYTMYTYIKYYNADVTLYIDCAILSAFSQVITSSK